MSGEWSPRRLTDRQRGHFRVSAAFRVPDPPNQGGDGLQPYGPIAANAQTLTLPFRSPMTLQPSATRGTAATAGKVPGNPRPWMSPEPGNDLKERLEARPAGIGRSPAKGLVSGFPSASWSAVT